MLSPSPTHNKTWRQLRWGLCIPLQLLIHMVGACIVVQMYPLQSAACSSLCCYPTIDCKARVRARGMFRSFRSFSLVPCLSNAGWGLAVAACSVDGKQLHTPAVLHGPSCRLLYATTLLGHLVGVGGAFTRSIKCHSSAASLTRSSNLSRSAVWAELLKKP